MMKVKIKNWENKLILETELEIIPSIKDKISMFIDGENFMFTIDEVGYIFDNKNVLSYVNLIVVEKTHLKN